ncbi:hypothetical protein IB269_16575 [Delftia sp. DLF01]|uniref:hypothetical protein n=1 Tax=Delftia sp. DLF01 TaxID=2769279 RepID=UPI001782E832|nr:hypothetical protein [Delftia sp. DLF01]MBD9583009.1 hypothetical protein [Delftia sp. DLF01]
MTHILIPRTPTLDLLRPFFECPTSELDQAWVAMVRIAEVQRTRAGRQCPAHIEQLRAGGAPVFDGCWKARMLDGRAIERDAQGLGEHPDLPWLDEGMNPPKFFEALGLQLAGVSAQEQLDVDAYDVMAGNYDSKEFNFAAWAPASPEGAGWCLVSIHDTEDGPVAWWLREQPYVAATRPVRRARERDDLTVEECREYLRNGWTRVRGRTEQALMLQLCEALEAGAAPAAVSPQGVTAWMHPETLEVISDAKKHEMSTQYGTETRRKAEGYSVAMAPVEQSAAAPALEAPAVDAPIVWPKARDVGRIGDMSPSAHLRIGLDSDNDVYASIWDERGGASIEFCTPGQGGGKSSRTRMALLAVMIAMEADNAADPGRDWWAERNHSAQAAAKGAA